MIQLKLNGFEFVNENILCRLELVTIMYLYAKSFSSKFLANFFVSLNKGNIFHSYTHLFCYLQVGIRTVSPVQSPGRDDPGPRVPPRSCVPRSRPTCRRGTEEERLPRSHEQTESHAEGIRVTQKRR